MPNDNFLYQMKIFYTKWWFLDWSVWFIDKLMEMPHLKTKYPSGVAKRRMKFKANLVFWNFLVVVYGFMHTLKDMNVDKLSWPTTKHFMKAESVKLSKGYTL